jgi:hypothetical protein
MRLYAPETLSGESAKEPRAATHHQMTHGNPLLGP